MVNPGAPLSRKELEPILEQYSSEALRKVYKAHFGAAARTLPTKQQYIDAILAAHGQPGLLKDELAYLTDAQRAILIEAGRQQRPTVPSLAQAALMQGYKDADSAVIRLLERGLLLATPDGAYKKFDLSHLEEHLTRRLRLYPGLEGRVTSPTPPVLELPALPEAQIRGSSGLEPTALIGALSRLSALIARKQIRVTQSGFISGNQYPGLEKDLQLTGRELPLPFVLEAARQGGITVASDGVLRPAPEAALLVTLPVGETIRSLFQAFVAQSDWLDDVPGDSSQEIYDTLRNASNYRRFPPRRDAVRLARATLVGLLRRLRTRGWIPLDAFVDAALELDPRLLFHGREPYSYQDPLYRPYNLAVQREYVRAVVSRTCVAFGLVELGRLDATLPFFACPIDDYVYWGQFRDERPFTRWESDRMKEKPRWQPQPCQVAFRLTETGREVLWNEARAVPATTAPVLTIGTDFEILAPRDRTPPELRLRLEAIAAPLAGHTTDPILRYRLERGRLIQALQSGLTLEALVVELERHSSRKLPANVARTLADWAKSYGAMRLYVDRDLLEFENAKARDRYVKQTEDAEAVGERFALAPRGERSGPVLDYTDVPARCIRWTSGDELELVADRADLLVERELAMFAVPGEVPGRYRLTRESVRSAKLDSSQILTRLQERSIGKIPTRIELSLRGWSGLVPPLRADTLTVLQVADTKDAHALLTMPETTHLIAGTLSPGLLVVEAGKLEALREAVGALGIEIMPGIALK
jgi:hypothetical protein